MMMMILEVILFLVGLVSIGFNAAYGFMCIHYARKLKKEVPDNEKLAIASGYQIGNTLMLLAIGLKILFG